MREDRYLLVNGRSQAVGGFIAIHQQQPGSSVGHLLGSLLSIRAALRIEPQQALGG